MPDYIFSIEDLKNRVYSLYKPGDKYIRHKINEDLQQLYDSLNYTKKAKASDLDEYFETKICKIINPETNKYENALELIKIKI